MIRQLALTFGYLSLISIGGANAMLPEIHRQVVLLRHWMDDATFTMLIAIAQAAPGPNVLIVSILGWHLAGWTGLVVATMAIVVPSCVLAFAIGRMFVRYEANGIAATVKAVLTPVTIGLMAASSLIMLQAAYRTSVTVGIGLVFLAVVALTQLSPIWAIGSGAFAGVVFHRLGLFG